MDLDKIATSVFQSLSLSLVYIDSLEEFRLESPQNGIWSDLHLSLSVCLSARVYPGFFARQLEAGSNEANGAVARTTWNGSSPA